MTPFAELLAQGAANAWLFVPSAILLGVLHGLEPGHSKTMMAAFIVAVRGTVAQAVLLGLAATVSHTAVVWGVALGGLYLWRDMAPESVEPWFQLASGLIIVVLATWMIWRARQARKPHLHPAAHHDHGHGHAHEHGHMHEHVHAAGNDLHARAHARDIERRFTGRSATTGQIIVFGLTGGLIPCPAAIGVLLLCLQLKELTLGFALVLCFSIGLAVTLVAVGAAAALGANRAGQRWPWLADLMGRGPYLSGALMALIGVYVAWHGWMALPAG